MSVDNTATDAAWGRENPVAKGLLTTLGGIPGVRFAAQAPKEGGSAYGVYRDGRDGMVADFSPGVLRDAWNRFESRPCAFVYAVADA